jgi:hypothetical protein
MRIVLFVFLVFLMGCTQEAQPTPTFDSSPTSTTEQVEDSTQTPAGPTAQASTAEERLLVDQEILWPGLHQDRTDLVAASGNCMACHSGLSDAGGADVSFDARWRASMHALAAVDPYWQASVSAEVVENPELSAVIENKCATCHMPLAWFDANANGETGFVLGEGFANSENPFHDLAMDAVSCTACHQITAENLGSAESYSGGFVIDAENTTFGERALYGPLPVSEQASNLMAQASGFTAVQSEHMADSAMCATCHTLYTPYLDANGEVAGEFPEQMAYFEWQNSSYAESQACQDCHMPAVNEEILISTVMGQPQPYLRLHTFTGANAFMLELTASNSEALSARAEEDQLISAISSSLNMLQSQTAVVEVLAATQVEGQLAFDVAVTSQTGHKFPTGFPSRRAWLHVTVLDASAVVVFESGAVDARGFIVGNDNDLDHGLFEPHYNLITSPDQVQIYETILGTTEGEVTTTLLYGASYLKDNRLLPAGFDLSAVIPETATHGLAAEDLDFIGGGDTLRYQVDVSGASGPFTVMVELNYQSIGYRWAENLREYGTGETAIFMGMYDGSVNLPVVVASVEVEVGE